MEIRKAACPKEEGIAVGALARLPADAAGLVLEFLPERISCSWCAALWVTITDPAEFGS